jgi:predicted outer membrane repeat protein
VTAMVQYNIIKYNLAEAENNWANSAGGLFQSVTGIFSHNEVANNTVVTGTTTGGVAGLLLYQPESGCVVSNNIFKGNVSNLWGGGLGMQNDVISDNKVLVENNYFFDNMAEKGGAFVTFSVPVTLQNNVFSGNHASFGGATYLFNYLGVPGYHLATLINNSFSRNTAVYRGGAIYSQAAHPFILNCIFSNDSSGALSSSEIYLTGSQDTVEVAYSDIDFNHVSGHIRDGGGNINQDPMFINLETLMTDHNSPCVDAGIDLLTCTHGLTFETPDYDILGNPRPQGAGYDMGAYDMDYWPVGIRGITNYGLQIANYPNPFTGSTTFFYTLKEYSQVILQIFNSFGHIVDEPVNTVQQKGKQTAVWDAGDLPPGMYYYRIQAGSAMGSGKMVKL